MNKEWKEHGKCSESGIMSLVADKPYDCFVAYQTDRFIAGRNTADKLRQIECDKLLEIRLFDRKGELLARRTMIGAGNLFQWRVADESGLSEDEYIVKYQTLDIDETGSAGENDGNRVLMTTGGGHLELPISSGNDRIRIISYVEYDADGMAHIYDNRLAGFAGKGGRGDV